MTLSRGPQVQSLDQLLLGAQATLQEPLAASLGVVDFAQFPALSDFLSAHTREPDASCGCSVEFLARILRIIAIRHDSPPRQHRCCRPRVMSRERSRP